MKRYQVIILLILILAIAGFFRLWHLNSIPPGLYPDEAMNGNDAVEALKIGQYKLFYPDNNGREGLFINLIAFSFNIFGIHIWSLKLVSALIGILTVLGLYLLTKELFHSTNIALLSAFFLATSFWHVNFSRIGFRAILVCFCLVWSFYFLFRSIHRNKHKHIVWYLLLSGVFFGLGFYTYISFRIAVIILIVPIIIIWLRFWKGNRSRFWQYGIWLLTIIIVALPMGLYFLQNSQDFIGRAGGVSIFTQENPIKALIVSTVKTLGMFNIAGDWNWRHNFAGSPQLFWPIGILFFVGLISSIKRLIKPRSLIRYFLLIWFAVMLLPAILTCEGIPHALRSIGVIPIVYIFAGLGAYAVYKFLYKFVKSKKLNKSLLLVACFLFLFACGYVQFDKYFIDWARQPDVKNAFAKDYVEIGKYLNDLPLETARYIIVNQGGVLIKNIPVPAQTIMFIQRTANNEQRTVYLLPKEIDEIEVADELVIIPLQYDFEIFKKLKEKFPTGKVRFQESFWLFEI